MANWESDSSPESSTAMIAQIAQASEVADVTAEEIEALRQLFPELNNGELRVFGKVVRHTGLDPWSRQIFPIKRRQQQNGQWIEKMTIQTAIDGYRAIAERTGLYAGQTKTLYCGDDGEWRDAWPWREPPIGARVGVLRAGWAEPAVMEAYLHEFCQWSKDGKPQGLWRTMPRVMLAKCAEAQALRKAFPNTYRNVYASEEMGQADSHPDLYVEARQAPPKALTVPVGQVVILHPEKAAEGPVAVNVRPVERDPVEKTALDMHLPKLRACRTEAELVNWYQAFKAMKYGETVTKVVGGAFMAHCKTVRQNPRAVIEAAKPAVVDADGVVQP